MSDVVASRVTGRIEGDFVVFLIGMRINKPWKLHKWLPAARAMPKMLRELEAAPPAVGFLGHTGLARVIVQYWRSLIIWSATHATVTRCIGRPGPSSIAA